jgi:LPS-assembly protein
MLLSVLVIDIVSAFDASAQFADTAVRRPRDKATFDKPGSGIIGPVRKGDKASPLYLNADELEYDSRNSRVIARGNVEIYYAENVLTADRVIYDQAANTLTAEGNARLKQADGAVIYGQHIVTTTDFAEAFVQSLSLVGKDDTRIVARRAIRRDGNVTEFQGGKFTPCRSDPGKPPLWCIASERIIHDKQAQTITYQDAQFEVLGTPIFYLPWFQHADPSVKSKSGFLMPGFGSSERFGFYSEVPYHFALAPNYDFLFHPMYMAKQGILWQGDWRHKLRIGDVTGTYTVQMAGIEQNSSKDVNPDLRERWRGSIKTTGSFSIASWWRFGWDITGESDKAFRQFYRLDNILQQDRVNSAYVGGMSERNYLNLSFYHVGGLILNENLDVTSPSAFGQPITPVPSQANTSRVLPVLDYRYIFANPILGGELKLNANAVSYWQDLNFIDGLGTGRFAESNVNRFTASVGWRRTLTDPVGQTYTPFFSVRGDVISTKDTVDPVTRLVIDDQSVTRGVATAGLLYAYPWVMATQNASHTIEPVAQVIARQNSVDQRRLPDLDARSLVFDDMNLFEEKTSGYDRIDVGVRANYGLQYTFQAHSGGSMRVLAGQSHHLSGDNIFRNPGVDSDGQFLYSPTSGLQRSASDYVLGLYVSPLVGFRAIGQARFDEDTRRLRRADSLMSVSYGLIDVTAMHSYTAASSALDLVNDQQEIIGAVGLKLTDRWKILAQTRYSIDTSQPIQDILQLRYADECFVVTTSYIETHIKNAARDIQPDRTVMLRFELKHLGEYAYKSNVLNSVLGNASTSN